MLCCNTNIGGPDAPTKLVRDEDTFDDGTSYELVANAVPHSSDYPEGLKYRFQYMDADGETLLRFDNFPFHPEVDRHHVHTPNGAVESVEFEGLGAHLERFFEAMADYRERGER